MGITQFLENLETKSRQRQKNAASCFLSPIVVVPVLAVLVAAIYLSMAMQGSPLVMFLVIAVSAGFPCSYVPGYWG